MAGDITMLQLRAGLGDAVNRVLYSGEYLRITNKGRPVAMLVPIEEDGPAVILRALAAGEEATRGLKGNRGRHLEAFLAGYFEQYLRDRGFEATYPTPQEEGA